MGRAPALAAVNKLIEDTEDEKRAEKEALTKVDAAIQAHKDR